MIATFGEAPTPLLELLTATARFVGEEHEPLEGEAGGARALELAGRIMRRAHEAHRATAVADETEAGS